jgi:DMSO/TMAO reductase YedYZ molybdopterin-dependent catalytic subunit
MRALTRAGRRTNVAILAVLVTALGSGVLAFAVGDESAARIVVAVHGILGLCLVVLTPWKAVIARRGLRRAGRRPGRGTSIALAVVVLIVVGTGLVHALGFTGPVLGVTSMQVHVGAAIAATALAGAHVVRRRQRPRPADLSRRTVLRTGAVVGGGVLLWSAVEATAAVAALPGADRRSTGSHERGTDEPQRMPVTQWLSDSVPAIDPATFRLHVVVYDRSIDLDLGDLDDLDGRDAIRAVLDCTGGWYATQDWRGIRIDHLLERAAGPLTRGRSVDVVSVTGYRRRLPLSDAQHLLLATEVADRPLSAGHGAPVRLVAPGRRGFWWVKWVTRIEVVDAAWWLQPPFPGQ